LAGEKVIPAEPKTPTGLLSDFTAVIIIGSERATIVPAPDATGELEITRMRYPAPNAVLGGIVTFIVPEALPVAVPILAALAKLPALLLNCAVKVLAPPISMAVNERETLLPGHNVEPIVPVFTSSPGCSKPCVITLPPALSVGITVSPMLNVIWLLPPVSVPPAEEILLRAMDCEWAKPPNPQRGNVIMVMMSFFVMIYYLLLLIIGLMVIGLMVDCLNNLITYPSLIEQLCTCSFLSINS
jgi:hypothetical protein